MVKNLTVSLDEESYRRARIAAAERGVSMSALVREYFHSLDREPVSPVAVPSLLDLLGNESVAELPLEVPPMKERPRAADL